MHYYHYDRAASARCRYSGGRPLPSALLDDLRALVEFPQAGSIAAAADRLYRTPSAVTRQLQRLGLSWVLSCSTAQ